jgi:hypothetical protein
MNVLAVGLVCIALYGVLMLVWLRYDKNRSDYAGTPVKGERS